MEIKISKTGRICTGSERAFVHGEEVFSLIRMENREFVREDYGKESWNAERARGAVAVWSTEYHDPKVAEQEPPEVFSPLRQAFYESAESEDRTVLAKGYLAAQLLRRQKVFRLIKESDEDEGESRVSLFADRIGNRFIEVRDPNFSYDELEAGRQALLVRLRELESEEEDTAETVEGEEESAGELDGPEEE